MNHSPSGQELPRVKRVHAGGWADPVGMEGGEMGDQVKQLKREEAMRDE